MLKSRSATEDNQGILMGRKRCTACWGSGEPPGITGLWKDHCWRCDGLGYITTDEPEVQISLPKIEYPTFAPKIELPKACECYLNSYIPGSFHAKDCSEHMDDFKSDLPKIHTPTFLEMPKIEAPKIDWKPPIAASSPSLLSDDETRKRSNDSYYSYLLSRPSIVEKIEMELDTPFGRDLKLKYRRL